jgi:hypothetical protein
MKRWSLAPVALLALHTGCTPPVQTEGALNPAMSGEVAAWRSYSWLPAPQGGDVRIYNDITRARLEAAVNRQLNARGFNLDPDNPDFSIAWTASIDRRLDVEVFDSYYGYGWGWWGPGYSTYVDEYDEGTLILDFVDADRNELAWRGIAIGRLSGATAQQPTQDQIDEAVEEVMEEFPGRVLR